MLCEIVPSCISAVDNFFVDGVHKLYKINILTVLFELNNYYVNHHIDYFHINKLHRKLIKSEKEN